MYNGEVLLSVRMCVKSLVDKAAFEAVGDDCIHLDNFCAVLEHIFSHRIQGKGLANCYSYSYILNCYCIYLSTVCVYVFPSECVCLGVCNVCALRNVACHSYNTCFPSSYVCSMDTL